MEKRVKKSDPEWENLNNLADEIAVATNPQAHFNTHPYRHEQVERQAYIEERKAKMQQAIDGKQRD